MWNSLRTLFGCSTLCLGLAVTSANAAESRIQAFQFPCDGQQKAISFAAAQLGNNVARFIQGAEVSLFEAPPGFQFVILSAAGNTVLVTLGSKETGRSTQFTASLFQTNTNNVGQVFFSIAGACGGGGQVQGFATIWFFS